MKQRVNGVELYIESRGEGGPLLMSKGDQSPPLFAAILDQIAAAVPRVGASSMESISHENGTFSRRKK